ncbi:MAG: riboflavin biosynthesis protein RibD [Omnitrophica WOR_2 bacterium GWA2_37_7]|nr:MAG: riboflavin biosynthesis protein RibD [Omnitrophica WOR_2 bacterium GWA2_37_7]
MNTKNNDKFFMQQAIGLALKAKGNTSPNPVVGAVIVKNGKVVSSGYHRRCGGDHAEVIALKKANGEDIKGATLYVTLEPCNHWGNTPPCVDSVIESGISEVVIAIKDPNPLTNGRSINKLRSAKLKVRVGVLAEEAAAINEAFIKHVKFGMPFVVAKCAQTLDGKIAAASGHSKWITSSKTRDYTHKLRDEFDAILVGSNTVLKDDPGLNGSKKSKKIKKIVLDSGLKISKNASLFKGVDLNDCIIATTKRASPDKLKQFVSNGVDVIVCPDVKGRVDMKWLFKELAKRKILSILIEGGAKVIGSALKADLVDKMQIIIAPKIIGDDKALSSIVGMNVLNVNKAIELEKVNIKKINKEIMVEGYVLRNCRRNRSS